MERSSRIYVAGGDTLIGAALLRRLRARGYAELVGVGPDEPDLQSAAEVDVFFRRVRPEYVIFAAGKSGGILANRRYPADLMLDNLAAASHVIPSAHRHGTTRLLYLASSCCYPKHCPQPMRVESLGTGPLEPTNDAYATAKIAGMMLCRAFARQHGAPFLCGIPANAFGIEDDFSPDGGHVVPALLARLHEAKLAGAPSVTVWGTGTPRRELIFADDLAEACLLVLRTYDDPETPINLGSGVDLSIREIAELLRAVVGYEGELVFDASKPDGMPLKSLDSSVLAGLGPRAATPLAGAFAETYRAYMNSTLRRSEKGIHVRAAV